MQLGFVQIVFFASIFLQELVPRQAHFNVFDFEFDRGDQNWRPRGCHWRYKSQPVCIVFVNPLIQVLSDFGVPRFRGCELVCLFQVPKPATTSLIE